MDVLFFDHFNMLVVVWNSESHTDTTTLGKLILNCVVGDDNSGTLSVIEGNANRATDMQTVAASDEGADLPFKTAVNLEVEADDSSGQVLSEHEDIEGGDGDVVAVDEG